MPHKHTRKPTAGFEKDFDLPPTSTARPLPISKTSTNTAGEKRAKKRKRGVGDDDTPREFKRLLAMQAHMQARKSGARPHARGPGTERADQRRKPAPTPRGAPQEEEQRDTPPNDVTTKTTDHRPSTRPLPERPLGNTDPSFAKRGPIAPDLPALRSKSSRLQRKIEKKVSTWREEDERLRRRYGEEVARRREEEEARIAEVLEKSGFGPGVMEDPEVAGKLGLWDAEAEAEDAGGEEGEGKRSERGRKKRRRGRVEDDWEVLKKREGKRKFGDVVKAPPELRKVKELLKSGKGKGGKQSTGVVGLKRKAELGEERLEVIRRYREMMGREGRL